MAEKLQHKLKSVFNSNWIRSKCDAALYAANKHSYGTDTFLFSISLLTVYVDIYLFIY
jgi:hypothetical protein